MGDNLSELLYRAYCSAMGLSYGSDETPSFHNLSTEMREAWNNVACCAGAHYQGIVGELTADRDQLRAAAPVMLTVYALLADEADIDGLREVCDWHHKMDPDPLATWLDAERARNAAELAKEKSNA